jgi:hypothetical protein
MSSQQTQQTQESVVEIDYLYIPRIKESDANFETVYHTLLNSGVGVMEYIDFVAIRDKVDRTKILYYSAFLKLYCWGTNYLARAEFNKTKIFKLFINQHEHWLLRPNNNPVPRSKINTHQLAAFTEELFAAKEDLYKKIEEQRQEIELQKLLMASFEARIKNIERIAVIEAIIEQKLIESTMDA